MIKLTLIICIFSTNPLFGQLLLDKDLKFQGAVKIVYQPEFKASEKDSEKPLTALNLNMNLKRKTAFYYLKGFLSSYKPTY